MLSCCLCPVALPLPSRWQNFSFKQQTKKKVSQSSWLFHFSAIILRMTRRACAQWHIVMIFCWAQKKRSNPLVFLLKTIQPSSLRNSPYLSGTGLEYAIFLEQFILEMQHSFLFCLREQVARVKIDCTDDKDLSSTDQIAPNFTVWTSP